MWILEHVHFLRLALARVTLDELLQQAVVAALQIFLEASAAIAGNVQRNACSR